MKLSGTINPNLLVEASINYDGNIINIVNSSNGNLPAGWSVNPVAPSFAITQNALPGMSYIGTLRHCRRYGFCAVAQRC